MTSIHSRYRGQYFQKSPCLDSVALPYALNVDSCTYSAIAIIKSKGVPLSHWGNKFRGHDPLLHNICGIFPCLTTGLELEANTGKSCACSKLINPVRDNRVLEGRQRYPTSCHARLETRMISWRAQLQIADYLIPHMILGET